MNKRTAYNSNKYVHLMDKVNDLKNGKIIAPQFLMIYPMNACNHLCNFCAYRVTNYSKGYHADNVDLKDKIANDLLVDLPRQFSEAGVKALECTGGGESLLHPKIKEFFREINKYKLEGALVTNGSMMDDEIIELIKDFAWVRLSINGEGKSYDEIQAPSPNKKFFQIGEIWEQLKKLNRVKSPKTIVGVSCIVTRYFVSEEGLDDLKVVTNANDLYALAKRAKEAGCDNVRFSLEFTDNIHESFDDIWPTVQEQMKLAKTLEDDTFTVFTLANERKKDREINLKDKPYKECRYTQFNAVITASAEVTPCCTTSYSPGMAYGSLYEKEFKDIWFDRARFDKTRNIDVNSAECNKCFMNDKNTLLEYMCEEEPLHINFP